MSLYHCHYIIYSQSLSKLTTREPVCYFNARHPPYHSHLNRARISWTGRLDTDYDDVDDNTNCDANTVTTPAVAAWLSGSVLASINELTLRRTRG